MKKFFELQIDYDCVHSCCIRLRCMFVIYLTHTHTDVVVSLLITSSMYICVSVDFVLSFLILGSFYLRNSMFMNEGSNPFIKSHSFSLLK